MYYDVRNREYVTMENGNWYFSPQVPDLYASYDLRSSFVVALSYNVHQPWMHHSLYSSHYPPYYYKSYYNNNPDYSRTRGFNENDKHAYYRSENVSKPVQQPNERTERETYQKNNVEQKPNNNTTTTPNKLPSERSRYEAPATQTNTSTTTQPQTSRPAYEQNAQQNKIEMNQPVQRVGTVYHPAAVQPQTDNRRSQPVTYTHPDVGQPVKVTRNMTPPRTTPASQPSNSRPAGNQNQKPNPQERR